MKPLLRCTLASLLLVAASATELHAQPAAQPAPDAVTEVARQRYQDGVRAFDAGRFEEARAAFFQAYALKQHPAVLLNLGLAELRSGKVVDAGNHLHQFMRDHKDMTPEQRATATQALDECKRRVALLTISVDQAGADVSVDGVAVGKAPLLDPVFVEPGPRTIVASYAGKNAMTRVEAKRGGNEPASVWLGAQPGVAPAPAPAPAPVDPAAGGPAPQPGTGGPVQPVVPPPVPVSFFGPQPPVEQPRSGREPFFDWYARKPLAWVGTGVFALGLGLGVGFSAAASSSASTADDTAASIREEAASRGLDRAPCGPRDGGQDASGFSNACDALREQLDVYDANVAVAVVGWVTAGVALGATVTYAIVDWRGGSAERNAKGELLPRIDVAPVLSPGLQGAGVMGTF